MSDQMPMFDDPVPPQHQPPKRKPRKPMKKRRKVRKTAPAVVPAAEPPKRRKTKKARINGHAGKRFSRDQYNAIRILLGMSDKELIAVLDIVKGVSR